MNLIKVMDDYILKDMKWPKRSHTLWDIGSCLRKMYWKWNNETESNERDATSIIKMKLGNSVQDLIFDFFTGAGLDIITDVGSKMKEYQGLKNPISFRVDFLFDDFDDLDWNPVEHTPEENKAAKKCLAGIEAKSSFGMGIREIKAKGMPKEDHLLQSLGYLIFTGAERWYIIYFSRDDGFRCQFLLDKRAGKYCIDGKPTGFDESTIIDRFHKIEEALERGTIPNRPHLVAIKKGEIRNKFQKDKLEYKSDWQCMYCGYLDKCWKEIVDKYVESDNSEMFIARQQA